MPINPNLIVIEIGRKAPKARRSSQRSRERLPPKPDVSTVWRTHAKRDLNNSNGPEGHDDVADEVAKRVGKQVEWRRAAWDEDWRKVDEQLRASVRVMDMEVIKSELATKALWKSRGRRKHSCLVRAFRALGINVPYVRDGPHWVLAEGLEMLRPHGYTIKPAARICIISLGRFVVCRRGHATAFRRRADDDFWSIDGKARKRVTEKHWDALVNGANIFEVLSSRNYLRGVRYCYYFLLFAASRNSPFKYLQRSRSYRKMRTEKTIVVILFSSKSQEGGYSSLCWQSAFLHRSNNELD